jgi:excisionase family DNA binding protein
MPRTDAKKRASSDEPPKFLTRKEAAQELRISLAKLDRVIARGDLKAKKHGHSTFVMASEIDRYIEQLPDVTPRHQRAR